MENCCSSNVPVLRLINNGRVVHKATYTAWQYLGWLVCTRVKEYNQVIGGPIRLMVYCIEGRMAALFQAIFQGIIQHLNLYRIQNNKSVKD